MCSLDHAAVIIEVAICLHIFLVDYRDEMKAETDVYIDRNIFNKEISDTNTDTLQVGNDNVRPTGHITDAERTIRERGLLLRHFLCQSLANHGIQRPSRIGWNENQHTHVTML